MYAGIAGALLVFTGVWRATEWMMDGRRKDTWALVPIGIVYAVLGYLIVTNSGGQFTLMIALLVTAAGGTIAYLRRGVFEVRQWVTWSFIVIDVIIVLCLLLVLLG